MVVNFPRAKLVVILSPNQTFIFWTIMNSSDLQFLAQNAEEDQLSTPHPQFLEAYFVAFKASAVYYCIDFHIGLHSPRQMRSVIDHQQFSHHS